MMIAQTIFERSGIDELWFVISPQNPFKKNKSLLHEFDRYDLVEAAIREHPKFRASDIEFNLPKPNYTINTLAVLAEKYPDHEFKLIIGGDNLRQFSKWRNSDQILENFGLLVYPRPGNDSSPIDHPNVSQIEAPLIDISATFIRKTIRDGNSIKYLVPEQVAYMIEQRGYYQ